MDLGVLRLLLGEGGPQGGPQGGLFTLFHQDLENPVAVGSPVFEVDGVPRGAFRFTGQPEARSLPYGGSEAVLRYAGQAGLRLDVIVRSFTTSPVLRMKYRLTCDHPARLTKSTTRPGLTYFNIRSHLQECDLTEYQLSHFDPVAQSRLLSRSPVVRPRRVSTPRAAVALAP